MAAAAAPFATYTYGWTGAVVPQKRADGASINGEWKSPGGRRAGAHRRGGGIAGGRAALLTRALKNLGYRTSPARVLRTKPCRLSQFLFSLPFFFFLPHSLLPSLCRPARVGFVGPLPQTFDVIRLAGELHPGFLYRPFRGCRSRGLFYFPAGSVSSS